jgi:hypothetical protein
VLTLIGSAAQAQEALDADEWEALMQATTPSAPEVRDARASVDTRGSAREQHLAGKPTRRGRKSSEQSRAAAAVESLSRPETASGASQPEARRAAHEQTKAAPASKHGKHGKRAGGETEKSSAEPDGDKSPSERAGEGEQAKHAAGEGEKGGRRKHVARASAAGERGTRASANAGSEKSGARESAKSGGKAGPVFKFEKSDRGVPANYVALKRSWHARWTSDSRSKMAGLAPALYIHPVHPVGANVAPYVLIPESTQGGFSDAQLAIASEAWGSYPGGPTVSRRLLNLIYHAALHFDVFHVHLISGVRKDRGGSRHTHGLAADIVLPGVEDEELAAYFRAQGFCGVGIYTRAGFTHIDTRDSSFFWLDWSLPGRKNRQQQIRGEEAKAADEAARARGQEEFVNPPKLQKALEARLRKRRTKSKASTAPANQEGS